MVTLSYNISTHLRENLLTIEKLRRSILLTPITTHDKRTFRFEAITKRIYFGLDLTKKLSLNDLAYFLLLEKSPEKNILRDKDLKNYINLYKSTTQYIYQEWSVTRKPVEYKTLQYIGSTLGLGKIRIEKEIVTTMLDYMETQYESPIIQSALALTQFPKLGLFSDRNTDVAHLVSLLYLYKGSYDFRGFISVEEEMAKNKGEFDVMLRDALRTDNQTLWLEYYTGCFVKHLEHVQARMTTLLTGAGWHLERPGEVLKPSLQEDAIERMVNLTRRQRNILSLIETPASTLTNKHVQDTFHVSQITASRDLSKLTALGLLVVHAKGRSTHYTKA